MMSSPAIPSIPITTGSITGFVCPAPVVSAEEVKKALPREGKTAYHRIAKVRENQGMSIQSCARKLGISVSEAREQEKPTSDLTISQLTAWKRVLEVPFSEIVIQTEDEPADPIRNRAMLLKVMKSVKSVRQHSREERIRILADNAISQLVALMPELEQVSAWPDVGQSHESRAPGVVATRRFDPEVEQRLRF